MEALTHQDVEELLKKRNNLCVLLTDENMYVGHGKKPEKEAIKKLNEAEPEGIVKKVIMASKGNSDKFEHVLQSRYIHLDGANYHPDAEICLHHPLDLERTLKFKVKELEEAQSIRDYSSIDGKTLEEIKANLKKKTIISRKKDREIVARLREYGLKNDVELYLVGSTTGRAGPRQLVTRKIVEKYPEDRKLYANINVAAVSSTKSQEEIFNDIYDILCEVDDDVRRLDKNKPIFMGKEKGSEKLLKTIPRVRYFYGDEEGLVRKEDDFKGFMLEVAYDNKDMKNIIQPDIRKRNWFHKLS